MNEPSLPVRQKLHDLPEVPLPDGAVAARGWRTQAEDAAAETLSPASLRWRSSR